MKISRNRQIVRGNRRSIHPAAPPVDLRFGATPVWGGRAVSYLDDGNASSAPNTNFAVGFVGEADVWIGASGGSGRQTPHGIKRIATSLAEVWAYTPPGIDSDNVTPLCNGENDKTVMLATGNRVFATARQDWNNSLTAATVTGPTTSSIASGTSHAVNIPSVVDGDLLIAFVAFNALVTVTPATGWYEERAGAGTTLDSGIYTYRCDGTEGATETFTTNASVESAWHVWKVPAGEWRDTGAMADATIAGTSSTSTGTAPNAGSPLVTWDGNYRFFTYIAIGSTAETISAYPAGEAGGSLTTSPTTCSIATSHAAEITTNYNPGAATKSGSARWVCCRVAVMPPLEDGTGWTENDTSGGLIAWEKDGTVAWIAGNDGISTTGPSVAGTRDGSRLISRLSGTWTGGGVSQPIAILNGNTGAVISTHLTTNVTNSTKTQMVVFGAADDKVLFYAHGVSATTQHLTAKDFYDIEAAALWEVDKTLLTSSLSVAIRILRRPDGGLVVANGDNNELWLVFIDEFGAVENQVDISGDQGALGTNVFIKDICYDRADHLYVLIASTSGGDVLRYDENMNLVWSLVALGYTQALSSAAAISSDVNLLSTQQSIWVGSTGIIYIGESASASGGVIDAYIKKINQVGAP